VTSFILGSHVAHGSERRNSPTTTRVTMALTNQPACLIVFTAPLSPNFNHHLRATDRSIDNSPMDDQSDKEMLIWTELQVPKDLELDPYFQLLLGAPGHEGSGWGRVQERPDTIILLTGNSCFDSAPKSAH
jgi:hypothetical protein